ncbi:MAG TPA: hypothetical protein VFZ53_33150 [Polyangiaceae bacterium]
MPTRQRARRSHTLRRVLVGCLSAALFLEVLYVAFAGLALPALLRERARDAGFDFRHERMVGFVPGRVRITAPRIETSSGSRLSLEWQHVELRLSLPALLRGQLVLRRFSGRGLDVRAMPPDKRGGITLRRVLPQPERAPIHASTLAGTARAGLFIERLESDVERLAFGLYDVRGPMRLDSEAVSLEAGELRAQRIAFTVTRARVSRDTVRVVKELTGRASLVLTKLRLSKLGEHGRAEAHVRVALRAVQPSFEAVPALAGLSMAEDLIAAAELDLKTGGLSGTARLTTARGLRWNGLSVPAAPLDEPATLTVSRRSPSESVRAALLLPILLGHCRGVASCVERVEGLRVSTEARSGGELSSFRSRKVEVQSGQARLRVAGRGFETQATSGTLTLVLDGGSLHIDQGTLRFQGVDEHTNEGRLTLATNATLTIDDGLLSRDRICGRGRLEASGANVGAVLTVVRLPWARSMLSGIAREPYSLHGKVRISPGQFELEDVRLFAARLSVRGFVRSDERRRTAALLFRYGAQTVGAVFDERSVSTRFGVGDRWLERQKALPLEYAPCTLSDTQPKTGREPHEKRNNGFGHDPGRGGLQPSTRDVAGRR